MLQGARVCIGSDVNGALQRHTSPGALMIRGCGRCWTSGWLHALQLRPLAACCQALPDWPDSLATVPPLQTQSDQEPDEETPLSQHGLAL